MFEQGNYPIIWKTEFITPINKVKLPEDRSQLRPLSGVFNFAKITDCIISSMIIDDMSPNRDMSQYGNEKGISLNPLMVNMIHRILSGVDKNSEKEKMAVFLTMIDHKRAFENQSHILGVRSFLTNGVRKSLIPVLINFFSGRKIVVKWKNIQSEPVEVTGGSPQGISSGILEYISQTCGNLNFQKSDPNEEYTPLDPKNTFKFVDDLSFIEVLNVISA